MEFVVTSSIQSCDSTPFAATNTETNAKVESSVPSSVLSSLVSSSTIKKLRWHFHLTPEANIDQYFQSLPTKDEMETIIKFSKFTRMLAGEDPEAPPDDEADEIRMKKARDSLLSAAALAASHEKSSRTKKSRRAQTFPTIEEGRKAVARLDDEWILMTVLKYSKRQKMYTLEDADDLAEKKEEHEIPRDLVIPLASSEYTPPCFPVGSRVLAMFPGTTSFYPATVVKCTKRSLANHNGKTMWDYSLQFDDDEEDDEGDVIVKRAKGEYVIEEVIV